MGRAGPPPHSGTAPGQVTLDLGKLRHARAGSTRLTPSARRCSTRGPASFWIAPRRRATRDATRADRRHRCQDRHRVAAQHSPVTQAERANITAHLTQAQPGGRACDFASRSPCGGHRTTSRPSRSQPAPPHGGVRRATRAGVGLQRHRRERRADPATKLYFSVRMAGVAYRANVWVHGTDARTLMPQPFQAEADAGVTAGSASRSRSRASRSCGRTAGRGRSGAAGEPQRRPVRPPARTRLAPRESGPTWQPAVWLVRANNDTGVRVARGPAHGRGRGALGFQRCRRQRRPPTANKLHFWVEVDGALTYSNFWTHGLDARTYLPNPEPPLGNCA